MQGSLFAFPDGLFSQWVLVCSLLQLRHHHLSDHLSNFGAVMRSSMIFASSTSPIHSRASLAYCEDWVTSLLKLIFQLLSSVGWGRLSIIVCSASLVLGPPCSVRAVISIGREVVGKDELGTASDAFVVLVRDVLGASANCGAAFVVECSLSWNSSGSLQLVVGDWLLVLLLGLLMKSMSHYCHQRRHLESNWSWLHPCCSEGPVLTVETSNLGLLVFNLCLWAIHPKLHVLNDSISGKIWSHSWCLQVHGFFLSSSRTYCWPCCPGFVGFQLCPIPAW